MKSIICICLGFGLGLYFADYRAVRVAKRETVRAVAYVDGLLR